jgi:peptidoglycan/xylan/chitin deacetylase (PgdA/CDA1 family)
VKAILTYHSIDDSGSPISVSPEVFAGHVRCLAASRFDVVSLEELVQLPHYVNAVAITFDDGFSNFATHAWPLLQDHGFPVTMFVVSDHAGGFNSWQSPRFPQAPQLPLMSWAELGRLAASGLTIGSHTRQHFDMRLLPDAQLLDELAGASLRIEKETGSPPSAFAYPYGAYNDRVVDAVRSAHRLACTTDLRFVRKNEDRVRLPRLDAYYFRRAGMLEGLGSGPFERHIWVRAGGRKLRRALELTGVRL